MKPRLLVLFFCSFSFPYALIAQEGDNIVFKYSCVPTSTTDYSIEIIRNKFILHKTEKIPDKQDRIRKVVSSNYTHAFNSKEKEILDSIIKINSITYNIDLPNYNNVGLESLIHFIVCLIPKKELPPFECKKCN